MKSIIGAWLLVLFVALPAAATPLPQDELQRACWLRQTPERTHPNLKEPTLVDFSNLHNGDAVRSPFLVEFAVRGMGVVPAGKALAGTGHHHILIDAPLPINVNDKIPFSDTHKHFGKGQTSTVLDLPPGKHTLRLLFADHEHKPYFVYSPEITINVTGKRSADALKIDPRSLEASCKAWYSDEIARPKPPGEWVAIVNVREGETLASPFNVRFGVEGYGVCATGQSAERTGHFVLEILQAGKLLRANDLSNGATQTNLSLANGSYVLRLRFTDGKSKADLLPASDTPVLVNGQDRL